MGVLVIISTKSPSSALQSIEHKGSKYNNLPISIIGGMYLTLVLDIEGIAPECHISGILLSEKKLHATLGGYLYSQIK